MKRLVLLLVPVIVAGCATQPQGTACDHFTTAFDTAETVIHSGAGDAEVAAAFETLVASTVVAAAMTDASPRMRDAAFLGQRFIDTLDPDALDAYYGAAGLIVTSCGNDE